MNKKLNAVYKKMSSMHLFMVLALLFSVVTCSGGDEGGSADVTNKWSLWDSGSTMLRGANIFQRRVYPDLDGGWIGGGAFGPPFTQADFDQLAALGANYVNISHPGLFSENAPYVVDGQAAGNLDSLLRMIESADMFAVITFRTGPGRNEFTITGDESHEWPESRAVYSVWTDTGAQTGWVEMWRYAANRYKDNHIVVGYDLMCEPHPAYLLHGEIYEPEDYYPKYANSLSDWNQLHPKIAAAIREVDSETPIIVGSMSWSRASWLPYLKTTGVERTVYAIHQYEPHEYSHQYLDENIGYPGIGLLETQLSYVDQFRSASGNPPVTANEYGIHRFVPSASQYIADEIALFEQRGMNHAIWEWVSSFHTQQTDNDWFDIMHGPDPDNHTDTDNSLRDAVVSSWSNNTARPSNASF